MHQFAEIIGQIARLVEGLEIVVEPIGVVPLLESAPDIERPWVAAIERAPMIEQAFADDDVDGCAIDRPVGLVLFDQERARAVRHAKAGAIAVVGDQRELAEALEQIGFIEKIAGDLASIGHFLIFLRGGNAAFAISPGS